MDTLVGMNIIGIALVVLLVASVATDVRSRRIPNVITLPAIGLGVALQTLVGGVDGFLISFAGFAVAVLAFVVPVTLRVVGAGDLKLVAAIGALMGPAFVLWTILLGAVIGGLIAIVVLVSRRQLTPVLVGAGLDLMSRTVPVASTGLKLPYAIPIALGAALSMLVR
jgi:prepilin peptidase CpaA